MARPRRTLTVLAAVLALGLGATACGGSDDDSSSPSASQAAPKKGGQMTLVNVSDGSGIDPFVALSDQYTDNTRLNAVYDSLFWHEAKTGRVMPQIGESLTPDASNTVWTLKIRPNVKFSDGTPYDAAAVKWTWDQHANPERHSKQAGTVSAIASTQVLDPTTLKITLKAPNANFNHVVTSNLSFVVSPTAYQKNPANFSRQPVGAGPFTLKEWVPGDHQSFVRNPTYWQGPDKPALDGFTIKVIQDSDQGLNTIASGGADIKVSVNAQDPVRAKNRGLPEETATLIGGESIFFNAATPPFDDVRARRAVALALDAKELNQVSFAGEGTATQSIFPPDSPLVEPGTTTVPAPDKAQSQKLLDELAAAGKPLNFTYLYPQNANAAKTAEFIQSRLSQMKNLTIQIKPMQIAAFQTTVTANRQFQAAMYSLYQSDAEPGLTLRLDGTSAGNYFGYKSDAVNADLAKGRLTGDPAQRKAAYTDLAKQLQQDVPMWTYLSSTVSAYHRDQVTGVTLTNDGMLMMDRIGLK